MSRSDESSVTVRQTPLTEMESPRRASGRIGVALVMRRSDEPSGRGVRDWTAGGVSVDNSEGVLCEGMYFRGVQQCL